MKALRATKPRPLLLSCWINWPYWSLVTSTRQISHSLSCSTEDDILDCYRVTVLPTDPRTIYGAQRPPTHPGRPLSFVRVDHWGLRVITSQSWCLPRESTVFVDAYTRTGLLSHHRATRSGCERIASSHYSSTPGLVGSLRLLDKSTANNKLPYWAIDPSV